MQKAKYRLIWNRLKHKIPKDKSLPIILEVYFSRENRRYIKTGFSTIATHWDNKNNQLKSSHPDYIKANKALKKLIADIEAREYEMIDSGETFDFWALQRLLKGEDSKSFLSFYEREMNKNTKNLPPTYSQHNSTLKHLRDFGKIDLFKDITYENIRDFDYYLRGLGLKQNTVFKHHKNLKVYLNLAIKTGKFLRERDPYMDFKVKKEKVDKVKLTEDELSSLESLKFGDVFYTLEVVRDLFLFSCYTGLRWSDLDNLSPTQVRGDREGNISLEIKMHKPPRDSIHIPLSLLFEGRPAELIKKHNTKDRIFPQISNQAFNRNLKDLAVMAQINKRLTAHTGRHTFATLVLKKSQNIYLVKELLGHSRVEMTEVYSKLLADDRDKELKTIDWNR